MNLPANDPISLALAHESPRPRRGSSARSPPPASKGVTRRVIRRLSGIQDPSLASPPEIQIIELDDIDAKMVIDELVPDAETPLKEPVKKIDWEIPRKALHSSIGFLTIYLYTSHGSPQAVQVVLWSALAVIVPADVLRLNNASFERTYEKCLGFLMRECEKKSINGVIWYIIGVNGALSQFPLDLAIVAILILSWADTAASTFGRMFGSLTPPLPARVPLLRLPLAPRKSLAGFIAATITGMCITAGFWSILAPLRPNASWSLEHGFSQSIRENWLRNAVVSSGVDISTSWNGGGWLGLGIMSVVAGLVTGVAEALDLPFDDNLTLPLISGGCLYGFFKLMSLFTTMS